MRVMDKSAHENVYFADQSDPYLYDVDTSVDPTRRLQDANDATLDSFFSRPLKIHEETWTPGLPLAFEINPWSLYFDNARVANRVTNYNLLRANLHIKIVINGNGFFYGRAIANYLPFDIYDQLSTNVALEPNDIVQASQMPHIYLDPCTSTGGEMKLPMFNYTNYMNIPFSQWSELGGLFIRSINDLRHANGASDPISISVFAWAEDVSYSVLTSVNTDVLSPQSGEIDEANKDGMISGPATAVAKVAASLTSVPYIGQFASATQVAATATSKIAKMFGYCRPPVTKNPEPYRPTPMSSLALTNTPDTALKLTVDDKQELSIDPRISGLGGMDSMNICQIAKRESFLTKFAWNIGTSSEELLWNSRIDPVLWAETPTSPPSFHFTAAAMAALPFQFWTGTMRFRFQIVASAFHKGRIKVVYDPQYLSSNEYNTNYLKVVDIAEEQDFTIEIGNGQDRTLLGRATPGVDDVSTMYGATPFVDSLPTGNGVIGIYVVNELTTPSSAVVNDIEVNVFVSMGDDFEVFVPDDHFQNFVFKPQSGEVSAPDSIDSAEPSAPEQEIAHALGPTQSDNSDINKVFTGEAITSFRTMLKRYNLWNTIPALDTVDILSTGRMPHFPYLRGAVNSAVDRTTADAPYNYCNTVMLHWVKNAFSGWRGSIRYKLIPRGKHFDSDHLQIQRARYETGVSEYASTLINMPTYGTLSAARRDTVVGNLLGVPAANKPLSGALGTAIAISNINGVLEFEMPYYSPFRFSPGKAESYTDVMLFEGAWDYRVEFNGNASSTYDIYVAAGEDFQTYFWTGLPRMYYEASAPL